MPSSRTINFLLILAGGMIALYAESDEIAAYQAKASSKKKQKKKQKKKVPRKRKPDEQLEHDLRPISVSFHPSHTLFGVQNSFLIGLKDGTIVKWNYMPNRMDKSVFYDSRKDDSRKHPKTASLPAHLVTL